MDLNEDGPISSGMGPLFLRPPLMTSVTALTDPRNLQSASKVALALRTPMFSGRLTHATIRSLDWIACRTLPPDNVAEHLRTGRRGEEAA